MNKKIIAWLCAAVMAFGTGFSVSAADTDTSSMPDLPMEDEVEDVVGVPMYINGKDFTTGEEMPSDIYDNEYCKTIIDSLKEDNLNYIVLDYSNSDDQPYKYKIFNMDGNHLTEDGWFYYPYYIDERWGMTSDSSGTIPPITGYEGIAITGYVGDKLNVAIPEEIDGLPVNAFGFMPFICCQIEDNDVDSYGEGVPFSSFYVGTVNVRIALPDHISNFQWLDVDVLKNMGIRFVVTENSAARDYFDEMGIDYDIYTDDDSSDSSSDSSSDVSSDTSSDASSDTESNSDESSDSSYESSDDVSSTASNSKASSTSNKVSTSSTANPNTGAATAALAGTAVLGMAVVIFRKKK